MRLLFALLCCLSLAACAVADSTDGDAPGGRPPLGDGRPPLADNSPPPVDQGDVADQTSVSGDDVSDGGTGVADDDVADSSEDVSDGAESTAEVPTGDGDGLDSSVPSDGDGDGSSDSGEGSSDNGDADGTADQDGTPTDGSDTDGTGDDSVSCEAPEIACGTACLDPREDRDNCGQCGVSCRFDQRCVGGNCICEQGELECGGACRDVQSDPANCGGCGNGCSDVQVCGGGACQDNCPDGTSVCSGACVDLQSSNSHCGTCGTACQGDLTCDGGVCGCPEGQTACGTACRDLQSSNSHCGTCNNVCPGTLTCDGGVCGCPEGQTACGATCRDLQTDPLACGSCGNACQGDLTCAGGSCVCEDGLTACGTTCRNLLNDVLACGACDEGCGANQTCINGDCTCVDGFTECGGSCVVTASDDAHCGGCDNPCAADRTCTGGQCLCPDGFTDCGGACVDTSVDEDFCGSCTNACADGESCLSGVCATCLPGEIICAEACTDTQTSDAHCGGCDDPCPTSQTCVGGSCVCAPDHLAPNGDAASATRLPMGDIFPEDGRTGAYGNLFLCPGAQDWFRVDVPGPWSDNVEIELVGDCSTGAFNPRVEVVSSTGSVSESATSGGQGGCPRIDGVRLSGGTRYIRVRATDGSSGAYTLRILHPRAREGTGATSRSNAVGPYHRTMRLEAQLNNSNNNSGNRWYRFDLHHAGPLIAEFERWGQFQASCRHRTNIELHDSGGSLIVRGTVSGNCGSLSRNLAPGTYYVRVYSESPFSGEYSPSLLAVTTSPIFELEPNDTPATATVLGSIPTGGEGALSRDDTDHWRITLPSTTNLVLQTRGPFHDCEADTTLELRSADGSTLIAATSSGGSAVHNGSGTCATLRASTNAALQNLPAGDYTVVVRGTDGAMGPYLINAFAE